MEKFEQYFKEKVRDKGTILAIYVVLTILLLFLWEKGAQNNTVRVLISSPTLVVDYFNSNHSQMLQATFVTFQEAAFGLLLAVVFCFGIMIVCFYIPKLMDFILPAMIISQVIPLITLAPLFIIVFKGGVLSKVMMANLLCFFPLFVNFANGVKLISKNIHELLFIYNVSITQKIVKVFFPLSLPSIMVGLKVSATLSVIGAIVAEFNGAEIGLGKNLFISAKRLEPELMINSLFLSAFLGALMYVLINLVEMRFGRWYTNK